MVSPDQKIDPNREINNGKSSQEIRRKSPARDFREVVNQLDQKKYPDDEENDKKVSGKKKSTSSTAKQEDLAPLSLFDLARTFKDPKESKEEDESEEITPPSKNPEDKLVENFYASVQQTDFMPIPPTQAAIATVSSSQQTPSNTSISGVQELIDQIAKEVYTLKESGKTETTITLQGKFEGSHLIIGESESAPGQINITIDNLTAHGQALIDMNKKALMDDLAQKNIIVHIFTATTVTEQPRFISSTEDRQSGRDREGNPQQQKKKDQQQG